MRCRQRARADQPARLGHARVETPAPAGLQADHVAQHLDAHRSPGTLTAPTGQQGR